MPTHTRIIPHIAVRKQASAGHRILNEYFNIFNLTVIKGTRLTAQQFVPGARTAAARREKCTYLFKQF